MRTLLISVLVISLAAAARADAQTIGYRGNPSHDSRVAGTPVPPLGVLWATDLGAPMSYPVVAEGLVFVSVRNDPGYGTQIVALDAATGAVRWKIPNPGPYWIGGLAYDAGRLIASGGDGTLRALAPATGAVLWEVTLGQTSWSSPPVAYDGKVYAVHPQFATLFALDGATGAKLWSQNVPGGGGGAPAVDADRIYISAACRHAYAYARSTGTLLWHHESDCSGGSDYTPAVSGGRVYAQGDNPAIYDAASGAQVGTATFEGSFGVADGTAYVPSKGGVFAADGVSWATRWTFGDALVINEAPLIGDGHLYVQTEGGAVIALDRATGAPAWCAGPYAGSSVDDHSDTHMGAGDGRLFVPSGSFLVAYGRGGGAVKPCTGVPLVPAAQGPLLTLDPDQEEIVIGRSVRLEGKLTGATAPAVIIQSDEWPFDGNWQTRTEAAIESGGTFAVQFKPSVNTRYRALGAGTQSSEITVYAALGVSYRNRNVRGGRFRESVTLTGPRAPRLTAKRLHLYLIKKGTKVARLAASPRLRGRAGRYTAAATLPYLRPRVRTIVIACYHEPKPDPWGETTDLDKACGAKRLRFKQAA